VEGWQKSITRRAGKDITRRAGKRHHAEGWQKSITRRTAEAAESAENGNVGLHSFRIGV
jgi:hypothetical protein